MRSKSTRDTRTARDRFDLRAARLTYLRVAADGTLDRAIVIASPWPAMVHDIAITRNYVVACVCPFVFNLSSGGPPATWQPERGARIAVVPRDAQSAEQVRWVDSAPFFNFHDREGVRARADDPAHVALVRRVHVDP